MEWDEILNLYTSEPALAAMASLAWGSQGCFSPGSGNRHQFEVAELVRMLPEQPHVESRGPTPDRRLHALGSLFIQRGGVRAAGT